MNFLRKSIYLFSSLVFCPQIMLAQKKIPVKPNILFILIDDLGKEWISTYGAENIVKQVLLLLIAIRCHKVLLLVCVY